MMTILSALISILGFRIRSRASLELELIPLRHQVSVLRRQHPGRIRLFSTDRLLWVWLYRVWPQVLDAMVMIHPCAAANRMVSQGKASVVINLFIPDARIACRMLDKLMAAQFQVDFRSHAKAILEIDFPEVATQLEEVLLGSTIPIEEIIGSGGGATKGTQRLRNALKARGWNKHNFIVERTIDGVPREAQSHEVDHIRAFEAGTVALEIEWNNKDPFFDRDLENFKRLHADGAISLGIIVTRGSALQDAMKALVRRFADENAIDSHDDMERIGLNPTLRQKGGVLKRVMRLRTPIPFREAWVDGFVSDKFGAATTHWRKLEDRVQRGVGNPCPLVLIGLPPNIVTFGEPASEVQKLLAE